MANYTNIGSLLESSLGLNEFGIGLLRSVEWSRKYLWSVRFLDQHVPGSVFENAPLKDNPRLAPRQIPDEPFESFFPAADVDIEEASLTNRTEESYYGPFEVPDAREIKTMRLTFFDDQENTLYRFFRDWINIRIGGQRRYTLPLRESLKAVEMRKLKLQTIGEVATGLAGEAGLTDEPGGNGNIAEITQYWVFPRSGIQYNANSQSETHLYSVDLVIAGEVDENSSDSGAGSAVDNITAIFGPGAVNAGLGNIL